MKLLKKEKGLQIGLILILFSSTIFCIEELFLGDNGRSSDPFSGTFIIYYAIALTYFVIFGWVKNGIRHWLILNKKNFERHTLSLVLFNICAYSLNKGITIFNESPQWLTAFLIIENIFLVLFVFLEKPPKFFQTILMFFMSTALVFNIYQTFMVLPNFPLGLMLFWFMGIPLLIFVPLLYVICIVKILRKIEWSFYNKIAFGLGIICAVSPVLYFIVQYQKIENQILKRQMDLDTPFTNNQQLPDWIRVAQRINSNPCMEFYLKSGLVYQEFSKYNDFSSGIMRSGFNSKYIHNPIVSIASIFKEDLLDKETKIRVLNYMYNTRHQTTERFWSGTNLKSKQVVTNIEIFPKERLSFSELIITIQNQKSPKFRWGNQQEALYTFSLPEGGVVTSLSLWIGGTEQKAILTSKKKAQKAYNTIVGKERRDPSVVYWMEGNKIRVRVFPCTPSEDRKFKIGVTAPLKVIDNRQLYQPIVFEGPDFSRAKAAINLVSNGAQLVHSSYHFDKNIQLMQWKGSYKQNWELSFAKEPISNGQFSYKNETFQAVESTKSYQTFNPETVYLDLSSQWTKDDLIKLREVISNKKVILFTTAFSEENELLDIEKSKFPTFTLFPFHKVKNAQNAIIITKGGINTPNLSDLKETAFKKELFKSLRNSKASPLVIDIEKEPTDFIKSLKEFRVIDYHQMKIEHLLTCFREKSFPKNTDDLNSVQIPQNGITIIKTQEKSGKKASNHLMRLFYYQQIMKKIGNKYFADSSNEYLENELVDKASIANIVTPLSSLIVLETQKDYERFEIEKNKDSLGNASINNSGTAPEPHEWALIIVGLAFVVAMYWKTRF